MLFFSSFIDVKIIVSSFRNDKFHFQEKMCQNGTYIYNGTYRFESLSQLFLRQ